MRTYSIDARRPTRWPITPEITKTSANRTRPIRNTASTRIASFRPRSTTTVLLCVARSSRTPAAQWQKLLQACVLLRIEERVLDTRGHEAVPVGMGHRIRARLEALLGCPYGRVVGEPTSLESLPGRPHDIGVHERVDDEGQRARSPAHQPQCPGAAREAPGPAGGDRDRSRMSRHDSRDGGCERHRATLEVHAA